MDARKRASAANPDGAWRGTVGTRSDVL